jgi:hypothetical protein
MATKKKPPPIDPPLPFPEPRKETGPFFLNDGPPTKTAVAREHDQAEANRVAADAAKKTVEELLDPGSASPERMTRLRAKRKPKRPVAEAVAAVRRHNNPADHPHTVARSILSKVNAWLEERGFDPVSSDTVAKEIPRS